MPTDLATWRGAGGSRSTSLVCCVDRFQQGTRRHGSPQKKSLERIAAQPGQKLLLGACLDSFSDDAQVQRSAQRHDGGNDRCVLGIWCQVTHKSSIDLQFRGREPLQIKKTGISGAEIINGNLHAHIVQFLQNHQARRGILHRGGLSHFERQISRLDRIARQNVAHELNETFGGFLVNLNAHTGTLDKVTTAFKEWNFVLSGGDKDLDARNERMNTLSMTTRLLTEERGRLKELDNADLAFQQNKGPTEMARLKAATQANIDLLVAQKAVAQQAIDAANGKASAPGPIGPTFGPSEPTEEWKKKAEEADKKAKEAAAKAAEARAKAMKAAQDDAVKGMEQQAKLDATAAEKAQKENDDFNAAMLGSQAKFDQDKYAAEYAAERKLTAMEAREDEARIKQDAQNNAQRVEAAKMAGAAVGASFITAMGNAIHQTNSGEDMDPGEFIKSLLPSLVGFGLEAAGFGPAGMMLGQAMTGAVMQQFATGGYVQPEHHAGGGYGGEGDTVPAMLTPGERILSLPEIGAMGGRDAVERAVSGGGGGGPTIINQISAMDTQSFQSYMGDRGGAGLVRAVRQNRGETAQMLRRAGAR